MPISALIPHLITFAFSSLLLWWGTGIVVKAISSLATSLKISAFTISFFILGLFTSLPEMMIGTTAIMRGESELAVGNLLGATLVLFLLVIPLLSLFGGGVKLPRAIHSRQLLYALLTIVTPAILIVDSYLSPWEGVLLIFMYLALFLILSQKESLLEKIKEKLTSYSNHSKHHLPKIIIGVVVVTLASQLMVNSAEYFAKAFNWSPFLVGLLIVAIGTNLPELSLVIRTVLSHKKNVALADYIGSASANTLLIGIFAIINSGIHLPNHTLTRLIILLTSLILFYIFIRSRDQLSRKESFVLIILYLAFLILEINTT